VPKVWIHEWVRRDFQKVVTLESLYVLFMNFLCDPYEFSDVMVIPGCQRRVADLVRANDPLT